MPKLSTTCDSTSARVGSTPIASTASAGSSVIIRRISSGIRRRRKPCMMISPAYVPTLVEARPDRSSATAKPTAAAVPSVVASPACTPSRVSVPGIDVPWKLLAATSSMARLTAPATPSAISTSTRRPLAITRRCASPSAGRRFGVSAECT